MSKKIRDDLNQASGDNIWSEMLKELEAEMWADPNLTEEEKRKLDEINKLPDEEWEPITCAGKPISETIIEDRGER